MAELFGAPGEIHERIRPAHIMEDERVSAKRTVDAVRPLAQSALATSPISELRDLTVTQENGALLISGSVSSFYHKQLAQEVVRAVAGQVDVVNSIFVP
jgi:osmotically-inducible protein OsmY